MCERREEADCFGSDDVPDCERECLHLEDLVTNADCQQDYDDYFLCVDSLDDVCDAVQESCDPGESCRDPKCDNEKEDLDDCIVDYCVEHPRNNECESLVAPPK
jgi:hypothetical protein